MVCMDLLRILTFLTWRQFQYTKPYENDLNHNVTGRSRRLNNRERDNESGDVNNLDWPQSLDTSRFKTNILLPDPNANEAITDVNEVTSIFY